MLKVALTGGIGSGKSAVGDLLQELGAYIIDSDQLARSVIERGQPGYESVVTHFGDEILTAGEIDRAKLAAAVFKDETKRKLLESIIHPLVRLAAAEQMKNLPADAVFVNEIPLLFETDGAGRFDFVISVQADEDKRRERLRARGMKDYEISQRISAQATDEQRASISDVVLDNNGDLEQLAQAVQKLWVDEIQPRRAKLWCAP